MTDQRAYDEVAASAHRYRLHRAGVLNVWQYDEQVFDFADGRLLLRGANGAGKSKTLEMLLPFVLDGDKMRITASGRHHTSLLWLMTDGYDGNRTGYIWVEMARDTEQGSREVITCGIGIRASSNAKTATSWYFTCPRRIGVDLFLEDDAGPLSKDRCRAAVAADGHFFEQPRAYKHHVGRILFGLEPGHYDELLRLLYWLRQPQVGEDIEPARLAEQLVQALPQIDDGAVRSAGDTFDELAAFGEQIDRRQRAAEAIAAFAQTYAAYAQAVARTHGAALTAAHRELSRRAAEVERARAHSERVSQQTAAVAEQHRTTVQRLAESHVRQRELEASPEARSHRRLLDLQQRAGELESAAERSARTADRAAKRAAGAGSRVDGDGRELRDEIGRHAAAGQQLVVDAAHAGVKGALSLPAALVTPHLVGGDDAEVLQDALLQHATAVSEARPAVGELLAAVQVVDDARCEAEDAAARRETEERRSAEAERRAEEERGRRDDAAAAARVAESAYADQLEGWRADPRAVAVTLPDLTADTVATLGDLARRAAAPEVKQRRAAQADAAAQRRQAEGTLEALHTRRRDIEEEHDPAPAEPALGRSARDGADGAPLWRLVDFADTVPAVERAGLEAGLESAGLLDAWVRADGAVLDADRLDVVLPLGPAVSGRSLAALLVADVPAGSPVTSEVVRAVVARIAVGPDSDAAAAVGVDGRWRLGPLTGRATKPAAQYVGTTARAAERLRRLAEVDAHIADAEHQRADAARLEAAAEARLLDLEAWLAALPAHHQVLTAWTLLDERTAVTQRAEQVARAAEEVAQRARAAAAERRRRLDELAALHALTPTADALAARREQLRGLDARLARQADDVRPLRARLARWARDWAAWRAETADAEQLHAEAAAQLATSAAVQAQLATLHEAVGASVQELQRKLAETRCDIRQADRRRDELQRELDALREETGAAGTALTNAQDRLREQQPVVVDAAHALGGLGEVPGLLRSVLSQQPGDDDIAALELARGVTADVRIPGKVTELARRLTTLPEPRRPADTAALYAAWRDASSSDAADHEPRIVPGSGDVLAALGRDDGGEHPVGVLADRLLATVSHDRELLTERERTLFEEHLIGDLGEVLRQRRNEAGDLVQGMNRLLAGVTTSQGIAVRLHWQLRDDVPDDARRAVTLLGRTVGSLLPDERAELRDALHRLIEASRAEAPEDSYAEHLARALDYRRWFAFRIRYTRPELDGKWQDLHRRSPLSQGEQKVVCYLPLFAAAAAHFTSLAGAAPYAPRFVLLDDAFPKIDVRTHPLLFGLLVSLDLDFVITSERLWGDHATVPSLAIYEALRDPAERGIAQYRYTWDGARLQAVGA